MIPNLISQGQNSSVGDFFSLDISQVLDAVETAVDRSHELPTGLCYALNSLENRVYEIELEELHSGQTRRVVAKFYRPGRWGQETILDEHRLLSALTQAEVPVCAPLSLNDGSTLGQTAGGIFYALFPKVGGRAVEELDLAGYKQLGRLLGRIHSVSAGLDLSQRPVLSPATYGRRCLQAIVEHGGMAPGTQARYQAVAEQIIALAEPLWGAQPHFVVHADCHRGNLLHGSSGWFFLDFDDAAQAPPVQDFWLLLPARHADCPRELEAMLTGYERFYSFDHSSLTLIEPLRALRYIRYAAWVATRWADPAFQRAFPQWGTDNYWQGQLVDLHEQLAEIENANALHSAGQAI